jgi:hypothetical protein
MKIQSLIILVITAAITQAQTPSEVTSTDGKVSLSSQHWTVTTSFGGQGIEREIERRKETTPRCPIISDGEIGLNKAQRDGWIIIKDASVRKKHIAGTLEERSGTLGGRLFALPFNVGTLMSDKPLGAPNLTCVLPKGTPTRVDVYSETSQKVDPATGRILVHTRYIVFLKMVDWCRNRLSGWFEYSTNTTRDLFVVERVIKEKEVAFPPGMQLEVVPPAPAVQPCPNVGLNWQGVTESAPSTYVLNQSLHSFISFRRGCVGGLPAVLYCPSGSVNPVAPLPISPIGSGPNHQSNLGTTVNSNNPPLGTGVIHNANSKGKA